MGRRWRSKLPITHKETGDMIEHTITKYAPIVEQKPAVVSYLQNHRPTQHLPSTQIKWSKTKCLEYIEEKQKYGFIIGAKVKTSYGNEGTIATIRQVPEDGLSFFGNGFPNIFTVYRPLMGDSGVFYNEAELTLNNN